MKKFLGVLASLMVLALASCGGGGGGGTILNPGGGSQTPTVGSIQVIASSTQLASDQSGASNVDIIAIVRDSQNNVMADVPVSLSATSGLLLNVQGTTDDNGQASSLSDLGTKNTR